MYFKLMMVDFYVTRIYYIDVVTFHHMSLVWVQLSTGQ